MAMSSGSKICNICENYHTTVHANSWCPECDEYLCSNCRTCHKNMKATRKHSLLDIASVQELPDFIFGIKTQCEKHEEAYEYFCPTHDTAFCVSCTPEHKLCGEFTMLRKMTDIKNSQIMAELDETIAILQSIIKKISECSRANSKALADQYNRVQKQIKDVRDAVNQHLDRIEKKVLEDLETEYKKQHIKNEKRLANIDSHKAKVDTIKRDLDKIKYHASNIHIFFSMRKFLEEVKDEENEIEFITKSKDVKVIQMLFKPTPSCIDGNILESLGTIEVIENSVDITLPIPKTQQAQLLVPCTDVPSIDDISLEKSFEVDLSDTISAICIQGCCFTDDDLILLTDDGSNTILVLDQHGGLRTNLKLNFSPHGIVCLDKTIFVSSFIDKVVKKLMLPDGQKLNELTFDNECDAVAVAGDNIIVHVINRNYMIYDQSLNVIGCIPVTINFAPFLVFLNDMICVPQWKEDAVYCYNTTGGVIWKLQEENLKSPHGIVIDNHDFLFVAGYDSSNIIAISQDGSKRREILNLKDLMTNPTTISMNSNKKRLLITSNSSSHILVYDVKYG